MYVVDVACQTMTLSGKYQQYVFPEISSKENGISNFVEEDSPGEIQDSEFHEVHIFIIIVIIFLWNNCCVMFILGCLKAEKCAPAVINIGC